VTVPDRREQPRRRLGLRRHAVLAFGGGAALLSAALSVTTYAVVHHYLLSRRQAATVTQAYVGAAFVQQELQVSLADVTDVLSSLTTPEGTRVLVLRHGRWYSNSISLGAASLPVSLTDAVAGGHVAEQRVVLDGTPVVAVGIPLPSVDTAFFEVRSLAELQGTFDTLAVVLAIAAVVTSVGGWVLGWRAARRLMSPIVEVSDAASAIASGQLDRRLPVGRDPDLAPLTSSFNDMVESLERRIERDARFASDVSHELRSPLTAVNTAVDLMDRFRDRLPVEGRRALEVLHNEVRRFTDMVQDLLEISRIDAGVAEVDLEGVPLDELVRHVVDARTTVPLVIVEPDARGLVIQADKRRLQRVLVNLLDNADAHAGGATSVRVARREDDALLSVEDGGPGITAGDEDRIFERFFRSTVPRQRGATTGTGLGLALVLEHVRAHGGRVTVQNLPGGGARFTVAVPLRHPPTPDRDPAAGDNLEHGRGSGDRDVAGVTHDGGAPAAVSEMGSG